ncbi:MAG: MoaD/ThiS family protein [Firmicutes bacterium]|nr:MoaD/ThiS family protein [Bacillota bacterium]
MKQGSGTGQRSDQAEVQGQTLSVRLVQLGKGVLRKSVAQGTTVGQLLQQTALSTARMELRVNGKLAEVDRVLHDGDLITLVPLIKGGSTGK